jgi:hypothetical protein
MLAACAKGHAQIAAHLETVDPAHSALHKSMAEDLISIHDEMEQQPGSTVDTGDVHFGHGVEADNLLKNFL